MTDRIRQQIDNASIILSQDQICGIMAAVDEVRQVSLEVGCKLSNKTGINLIRQVEKIEGIILDGTYEPGGKLERS